MNIPRLRPFTIVRAYGILCFHSLSIGGYNRIVGSFDSGVKEKGRGRVCPGQNDAPFHADHGKQSGKKLIESEAFHRIFFEDSPIGLVIQDFSAVEQAAARLRQSGVQDIRAYLTSHPGEVAQLAEMVQNVRANQAMAPLTLVPIMEEAIQLLRATIPANIDIVKTLSLETT